LLDELIVLDEELFATLDEELFSSGTGNPLKYGYVTPSSIPQISSKSQLTKVACFFSTITPISPSAVMVRPTGCPVDINALSLYISLANIRRMVKIS
jgi:hypothetical protein